MFLKDLFTILSCPVTSCALASLGVAIFVELLFFATCYALTENVITFLALPADWRLWWDITAI